MTSTAATTRTVGITASARASAHRIGASECRPTEYVVSVDVVDDGGPRAYVVTIGQAPSLRAIANIITSDTHGALPFGSSPYISAMGSLSSLSDTYGADSAADVVRYALSNLSGWRGPVARETKTTLKAMLATHNARR